MNYQPKTDRPQLSYEERRERVTRAIARVRAGESIQQVAAEEELSYKYLRDLCRGEKTPRPNGPQAGRALAWAERRDYVVTRIRAGATMPEMAEELGITRQAVGSLLKRAGYLVRDLRPVGLHTDPAAVALLGTDTDAAVASMLGRTPVGVLRARRVLGIPAYDYKKKRREATTRRWVGRRHGRLVVREVGDLISDRHGHRWLVCDCDCGTRGRRVSQGNFARTWSCGCLRREMYAAGGGRVRGAGA